MSPHDYADHQSESVADAVTAMKLESDAAPENSAMPNGGGAMIKDESSNAASNASPVPTPKAERSRSSSRAPVKKEENYEDDGSNVKGAENNHGDNVEEEKVGGDIIVKLEPGQPPKLTRSSSQKVVPRPPQLFAHLPDSTAEAQATFDLMDACTYANKYMGYTEHAMECDCAEEWGKFLLIISCAVCLLNLAVTGFIVWLLRVVAFLKPILRGGWERPPGLRSCLFVYFLSLPYLSEPLCYFTLLLRYISPFSLVVGFSMSVLFCVFPPTYGPN